MLAVPSLAPQASRKTCIGLKAAPVFPAQRGHAVVPRASVADGVRECRRVDADGIAGIRIEPEGTEFHLALRDDVAGRGLRETSIQPASRSNHLGPTAMTGLQPSAMRSTIARTCGESSSFMPTSRLGGRRN